MSWSYSTSIATDKDMVRFLIGDTDTTDQLLSDEEISALLALESVYNAAATASAAIAANYARKVDKGIGDLSLKYSQLYDQYTKKSKQLRRQASIKGIVPYAGGISIADKDAVEADTDRVKSLFERGQFANKSGDCEDDCECT